MIKRQYEAAISDFSKVINLNPNKPNYYIQRGYAYKGIKKMEEAIYDFNRAIELDPKDYIARSQLAWLLATCPDKKYRDGIKAIEHAEKLVEFNKNPARLDTLAAAYAEAGRFEDAVKTQEIAIDILKNEGSSADKIAIYLERLDFYKENKPWRDK
jgi:tetratricopeptide (TPR) repeat protein